MEHTIHRSPRAATAIAAVLALVATPALAQAVAPIDTAPAAVAAPANPVSDAAPVEATAAAPQIDVAPVKTAPAGVTDAAIAAPAPLPATPIATAASPRSVTLHRAPRATEAPRPAPAATLPSAPTPAAKTKNVAPEPTVLAVRPAIAASPQPGISSARAAHSVSETEEIALALAAAAALGIGGYAAWLARRRREQDELDQQLETSARVAHETALAKAPAPTAEPVMVPAVATFAMPFGPVPTGAARNALIAQMVASAPDEANPFRSLKGRTRRARLMLQHREQQLRDAATAPFDWRNYQPFAETAPVDALPMAHAARGKEPAVTTA